MIVTKENIGEIIEHMYHSEIDFHMGFLYDGGIDYCFDNNPYPLVAPCKEENVQHTGESDIVKVFTYVVGDILKQYPTSGFSKWWNGVSNSSPSADTGGR